MTVDQLLALAPYGVPQREKEGLLLERLNELTSIHSIRSSAYGRLSSVVWRGAGEAESLEDVPYVPVGLFKTNRLVSVPDEQVFATFLSSGTTGQEPSRIYLDTVTAQRQTVALSRIMGGVLGPDRLPMLLVESRSVIADRRHLTARSAGVLGMMNFGRAHQFVLDADMRLDEEALRGFLEQHGHRPFLVFGFTFMVWRFFYRAIAHLGLDLSNGVLIHSGGWKKLAAESVTNEAFKRHFREASGLRRIHNFYGMVEQVGSVFLEGEDGFLYPPAFADVIVRDPRTLRPAAIGEAGIIQVLSALPESYPGHSILTEDLGVIHGVDDSSTGWMGKRFSVIGRVPAAEVRGCSDTFSDAADAA